MSEPSLDAGPVLDAAASLGEIDPARSRHVWRRSGVVVSGDLVAVGTWGGEVIGYEYADADLTERWRRSFDDSPVTLAVLEGSDGDGGRPAGIVVGTRGDRGAVALLDPETGDERWSYDGADDVGEPAKDSVFYWPYVVDLATDLDGESVYAAVRRYERDGDDRVWHSAVLAFDRSGEVRWRYAADASPISLDLDAAGRRLAVGYNRCFGDHQRGLIVLDTDGGTEAWTWDPGVDGDRRVGDVAFDPATGDLAVTSHGDFRGYLFDPDGEERWRVDLATETERAGQTLYAYPNHALARDGRVVFVTGNTYALERRETEARHPYEHAAFGFDAHGERAWTADTRGFVHEVATDGTRLLLPTAQNFRVRDPDAHALRAVCLDDGSVEAAATDGILTSAAADDRLVAAVEEPIAYHDGERTHGAYAVHVGRRDGDDRYPLGPIPTNSQEREGLPSGSSDTKL